MAFTASSVQQSAFFALITSMLLGFSAYAFLLKRGFEGLVSFKTLLGTGIFLRIMMFFWEPQLSDDVYRFIWDARVILSGLNPLSFTPTEILNIIQDPEQWQLLYVQLNSPDYYTVYPPVAQFMFVFSKLLGDTAAFIFSMRLFIFCAELYLLRLLVILLKGKNKPMTNAMIFFLNPLVIIEGIGNIHFEAVCILFFVWGIVRLTKGGMLSSAGLYAMSIATKLLPLMFFPILWSLLRDSDKRRFSYTGYVILFCVLLFAPFFLTLDLGHFFESLNLYFQKFEFNASVYYICRFLGRCITGYNQIWILGPTLSVIALMLMLRKLKRSRLIDVEGVFDLGLYFFLCYLLMATTVHPWYLMIPLCMSVFRLRIYLLVWSFAIFFSYALYHNYNYAFYHKWVFMEYAIVGVVAIWEMKTRGKEKALNA